MQQRSALAALLMLLAVVFSPASGEAGKRRVRGLVLAVFNDGSFQFEDGLTVRVSRQTTFSRPLLVGQPVEAFGETTGEGELTAGRVEAHTVPGGEVRGEAVLEESREIPRGTLLLADGRRLLVTNRTRRGAPVAERDRL